MRPLAIVFATLFGGCSDAGFLTNRQAIHENIRTTTVTSLEDQLAFLASVGVELNPSVTIDDLLATHDRDSYERNPYKELLFLLGTEIEQEPWGRRFCSRAWNFDLECIYEVGDYRHIANTLSELTGDPQRLTDINEHIDFDAGVAWLEYSIDGQRKHIDATVRGDWVDPNILETLLSDLETDGRRFFAIDGGQVAILYFLTARSAAAINAVSDIGLYCMLNPNLFRVV